MTADAMSLIAERCALLTEADGAMILLTGDDGGLTVWAATGVLADAAAGLGQAAVAGATDPWITALHRAVGVCRSADFPAPKDPGLARAWVASDSLIVAPIPVRGGVGVGGHDGGVIICLRSAGREAFEPESEPELVGLAEQASIALEVVGRAEKRRLAELMADRERIARDLHDQVIQRLYAVGLTLQGQLRRIADPTVAERVDHAIGEIDEAIADLRASIFDLRATADSRTSLRRRLSEIVAGANGANGANGPNGSDGANSADGAARRVVLRCRGPIDTLILPELAAEVEAVVREAVSNAVKHSGATTVAVTVTAADSLHVTVADNGRGIPSNVERSGLKNLAERAKSCGGELHVDSVIRGSDTDPCAVTGTTLRWAVPL
ncbi:MAG: histidine kinase [Nakamurella sp.]